MRRSPFVIGSAAALLLVAVSGCRIAPKEQLVFEDNSPPPQTASRDWKGETITIHNEGIDDGVNDPSELGGIEVIVSSTATRVSVVAIFAAHADDDKPGNAGLSIADAKKTLGIAETATSFDVTCGHGETHGTARGVGSGCKLLRVTIPAGNAAMPHALVVDGGSGFVRVGRAESTDAPHVKSIVIHSNGVDDVDVRARPVKDATLAIEGRDRVTVALPGDFSAKSVLFSVASADGSEVGSAVVATDFPGMTSGSAYPASAPSADAITELNVHSTGPSAPGVIKIAKF